MRAPWVIAALALGGCGLLQAGPPTAAPAAPGAVLASVPIGRGPTRLAVSPDGAIVYAASVGTLAAIDTGRNTIVTSTAIDPYTNGLAVTPDGRRVLLTAVASAVLTSLPAGPLAPPLRIELPKNLYPGGYGRLAVSADGRTAWVVNEGRWVAVVDLASATARRIPLDLRPNDVAFGRDAGVVYLAGCQEYCTSGTIEAIDAGTGSTVAAMAVGPGPARLVLSPDGAAAFTTNLGGPSLSVVDLGRRAARPPLPVGVEPTGLAVSPDGRRVYVTSNRTGTLTIVRGDGQGVVATVQLAGLASDVVVGPDGRRVYVATSAPNAVVVLDAGRLGATP